MNGQTQNLLVTIAENQPKIKQQGYDEGYDAGKQAEYDAFWEGFQWGGTRTNYAHAFYYWEGTEYIRPKYKVVPRTTLYNMFAVCRNLKKIEAEYFDLSQANVTSATNSTGLNSLFYACRSLEEIEDIGLPAGGYNMTFNGCTALRKIAKLKANEDCQFLSAFTSCTSLKEVTFEGVIGQNINFQHCPLSITSLKSIVKHLKDYTGTSNEFVYTVTFKTSAFNQLGTDFDNDDYEWFESTFNMSRDTIINANLSWRDMIAGLCWNLVLA